MNLAQFMRIMQTLIPGKRSIPDVARELGLPDQVVRVAMKAAVEVQLVEEYGSIHSSRTLKGKWGKAWRLTYRGKMVVRAWFPRSGELE